jgi:hypothetical protein
VVPRLASSREWSPYPSEYAQKILEVLNQTYPRALKDGRFVVEGRIYREEILLRVGYVHPKQLTQINFETSIDFDYIKQTAQDRIGLSVDAAGILFDEYFENLDDLYDYPRQWEAMEIGEQTLYIQFSTINTELEKEANRLLGLTDPALVNELSDSESEDALNKAIIDTELATEIQKKIREGHDIH